MNRAIAFGLMTMLLTPAHSCLLPELAAVLEAAYASIVNGPHNNGTGAPIGTGDRFLGGRALPQGLGTNDRSLDSILNVREIESGLRALAREYGDVHHFVAPYTTFENRSMHGVRIGEKPRVFIQAGIHGRERGGPDNVLYFLSDLLHAKTTGAGLSYGTRRYSNEQVNSALSVGLVVLPLVNPDGTAHDQATGSCSRKNRNSTSVPADGGEFGVDLDRNFDINWDYERVFHPEIIMEGTGSNNPASPSFHGLSPFSEAETRNVAWTFAQHRHISWFLDVHSALGATLWGWGDDSSQSTTPEQNFLNKAHDGKRGLLDDPEDSVYQEFLQGEQLKTQPEVARRMSSAMAAVANSTYAVGESVELYPTSGGSTDYAMSGYYGGRPGAGRINGLTMEYGKVSAFDCPFYQPLPDHHKFMRETAMGMMEFLLSAAN